jgi:hypothetical protein
MTCQRIKGIVLSDDFALGETTLKRVTCKMWDCSYCGPINASRWRAYLLKKFNQSFGHEKWCFYTITAHKNAHKSPETSIKNLQQVWKRLYDRMRRHYKGKRLDYVRIFEPHKSGRFHMHILINVGLEYDKHAFVIRSYLDEFRHPECKWLRRAVTSLGGGWRCHIRRVWDDVARTENVGLVVGYITKYMSKQMASFKFPKNQRRVQTSRAIGSPDTDAKGRGNWHHMRELSLETVLRSPKPIIDVTTGERVVPASFEGEHYYPPLRFYRGN